MVTIDDSGEAIAAKALLRQEKRLMHDARAYPQAVGSVAYRVAARVGRSDRTFRLTNSFMERNKKIPTAIIEMDRVTTISFLTSIDSSVKAFAGFESVPTSSARIMYAKIRLNPAFNPRTDSAVFAQVNQKK
jgi:hypothetical protein